MNKKSLNIAEFNTETERAYKARKVIDYVYQTVSQLPDAESRAQAGRTALELLKSAPEP